jgi:lipopolysaccharide transport protein LptA
MIRKHSLFLLFLFSVGFYSLARAQTNSAPPDREGQLASTAPKAAASASAASAQSPARPFTTINSDSLSFDYEKKVAVFEGNVVAIDPQLTLRCRVMKIFFAENSQDVARVEAYEDVHMLQDRKEGVGQKAVFTKETGIIVLSEGQPKLRDEKGNWILSRGSGIIYNINTKQMNVDKPTLEFQNNSTSPLK